MATTKKPQPAIMNLVIDLGNGYWVAFGQKGNVSGTVHKIENSPFAEQAKRRRPARKSTKAAPARKPRKGKPKLSLVRTGYTHHKDGCEVVEHWVRPHKRTLPSGKVVKVRGYKIGPHARTFKRSA